MRWTSFSTSELPIARLGGNFQYEVVPEPSILVLVGLGAIGALAARRRHRLAV